MLSESEQDYLKAIYEMQVENGAGSVSTTGLAQLLGVSPASVTEMVQRLAGADHELVKYERYRGARLSEAGERAALEVIRHHRLLESFLQRALGYTWDEVHAEAHRLEHAISEDLEERMAAYLGQPAQDPHGAPIPSRDGTVIAVEDSPLTGLPVGERARIRRVSDHDPALLRYLAEIGLVLDATIEIAARDPFDGPLHVRLLETGEVRALGAGVTDHVFVATVEG